GFACLKMRIIWVDRDRRAGKPTREHLMFDVVQVDSYLHRHGYHLLCPDTDPDRAAGAGSAWNSSKQVPADPGAVDPGTASYCARAVTLVRRRNAAGRSATGWMQLPPDPRERPFSGGSARYDF